jgi:HSP20 family protein
MLTVKGEANAEQERDDMTYILHERLSRAFERRFQLPEDADTKQLVARFEDGVLEIHAPKIPGATPRKITIDHES